MRWRSSGASGDAVSAAVACGQGNGFVVLGTQDGSVEALEEMVCALGSDCDANLKLLLVD